MGLLLDILRGKPTQRVEPVSLPTALVSPYQSASASLIAWADHFNGELGEVNRLSAMQIPAIAKARNVLASMIAGLDLQQLALSSQVDAPWLYRSSALISPYHRMVWTVDDLFFHGWSLWAVSRDGSGQIQDAARVPIERWTIDQNNSEIRVDNKVVRPSEVILIPGSFEGILTAGAQTIKGARALERAWIGRAQNPIPLVELHATTDEQIDPEEVEEMIAAWSAARTSPTGAVGFTDHRIEMKTHGEVDSSLFEEGRNAVVLDIARLTGLPAALLDGSMSTASLTYSTQEHRRNEFLDYTLPMWLAPIEARLSLDDVCPVGERIRFDRSPLQAREHTSPTAPPIQD